MSICQHVGRHIRPWPRNGFVAGLYSRTSSYAERTQSPCDQVLHTLCVYIDVLSMYIARIFISSDTTMCFPNKQRVTVQDSLLSNDDTDNMGSQCRVLPCLLVSHFSRIRVANGYRTLKRPFAYACYVSTSIQAVVLVAIPWRWK